MTRLRERSVLEIMVLVFMATVAAILVVMAITVAVVKVRDPSADTDTVSQSLVSLTSGILGALLGLLAGRNAVKFDQRPDGTESRMVPVEEVKTDDG